MVHLNICPKTPSLFTLVCVLSLSPSAWSALAPATWVQWQQYSGQVERRIARQQSSQDSFLPSAQSPANRQRLRNGEVVIERFAPPAIPGGLIHHWAGTVFIAGATLDQVEAVLGNVAGFPRYYAPNVISARVLSSSPPDATIILRLRKDSIVTVVLQAEYQVRFARLDSEHRSSSSRSLRIQEVQEPGKPNESLVSPARDHGFLWAMNAYWSYVQTSDGVYVRCESLSLSRDIPFAMGWLLGPVVSRMPRDSLRFTLEAIRNAVLEAPAVSISTNLENSR